MGIFVKFKRLLLDIFKMKFIFFLLENNWVRLIYPIYSNLQPVEKLTVNAIRTELSSIRDPPFYESQFFHRP